MKSSQRMDVLHWAKLGFRFLPGWPKWPKYLHEILVQALHRPGRTKGWLVLTGLRNRTKKSKVLRPVSTRGGLYRPGRYKVCTKKLKNLLAHLGQRGGVGSYNPPPLQSGDTWTPPHAPKEHLATTPQGLYDGNRNGPAVLEHPEPGITCEGGDAYRAYHPQKVFVYRLYPTQPQQKAQGGKQWITSIA